MSSQHYMRRDREEARRAKAERKLLARRAKAEARKEQKQEEKPLNVIH